MSQKPTSFYFCIIFVKTSSVLIIFDANVLGKFATKFCQNRQSFLTNLFVMPCEMEHLHIYHKQRQLVT